MNKDVGQKEKVFFLLDTLHVGGTEVQAVEAAVRLQNHGKCDVTVGCLNRVGPLIAKVDAAGIPIFEFRLGGSVFSATAMRQIWRLSRILKSGRFKVIHCHDQWSNIVGVLAGRLAGTAIIITSQRDFGSFTSATGGWSASSWKQRTMRGLQRASSFLLVNSQAIKDAVVEEGRVPAAHIKVVRNGVEWQKYAGPEKDAVPLPVDLLGRKVLIHVANMNRKIKGHDLLMEATGIVCKQQPSALFLLVGEGELRPGLEERVRNSGLDGNVIFLGKRSDVPQLLKLAHIGLLTSLSEGLPNSVLEYMAAGLAVVATNVGGVRELIEDGVSGFAVPLEANAVAEAILKLMQDETKANDFGAIAAKRAREDFSFERLVADLEALYSPEEIPSKPAH